MLEIAKHELFSWKCPCDCPFDSNWTFHNLDFGSRLPFKITFLFFVTYKLCFVKMAVQLSSHNCGIDINVCDERPCITCVLLACLLNSGMLNDDMCVDWSFVPSGMVTVIGSLVSYSLSNVPGLVQWIVAPVSAIACIFLWATECFTWLQIWLK